MALATRPFRLHPRLEPPSSPCRQFMPRDKRGRLGIIFNMLSNVPPAEAPRTGSARLEHQPVPLWQVDWAALRLIPKPNPMKV